VDVTGHAISPLASERRLHCRPLPVNRPAHFNGWWDRLRGRGETWILQATYCARAHALGEPDRRFGAVVIGHRAFSLP